MSRLADALRELRVFNNYDLMCEFGEKSDLWVEYNQPDYGRGGRAGGSSIHSAYRKTDPDGHWMNNGCKKFLGNRAESMPKALAWADEQMGPQEWVPSPFGGKIPKRVLVAAKAAVKAGQPAHRRKR